MATARTQSWQHMATAMFRRVAYSSSPSPHQVAHGRVVDALAPFVCPSPRAAVLSSVTPAKICVHRLCAPLLTLQCVCGCRSPVSRPARPPCPARHHPASACGQSRLRGSSSSGCWMRRCCPCRSRRRPLGSRDEASPCGCKWVAPLAVLMRPSLERSTVCICSAETVHTAPGVLRSHCP